MNYKPYCLWYPTVSEGTCNIFVFLCGCFGQEPGEGNVNKLDEPAENNVWIDGTEGQLFLTFCNKFNCTISLGAVDDNDWGETFGNGSGSGMLGKVARREVDAAAAALFLWYNEN